MIMSILGGQQKKILALEKKLKENGKADLSTAGSGRSLGSGEAP